MNLRVRDRTTVGRPVQLIRPWAVGGVVQRAASVCTESTRRLDAVQIENYSHYADISDAGEIAFIANYSGIKIRTDFI